MGDAAEARRASGDARASGGWAAVAGVGHGGVVKRRGRGGGAPCPREARWREARLPLSPRAAITATRPEVRAVVVFQPGRDLSLSPSLGRRRSTPGQHGRGAAIAATPNLAVVIFGPRRRAVSLFPRAPARDYAAMTAEARSAGERRARQAESGGESRRGEAAASGGEEARRQ